jgi:hypothetical protein
MAGEACRAGRGGERVKGAALDRFARCMTYG